MKEYDIETKSWHKVVSIDYDDNTIVMASPKYGRTSQYIDKVRLLLDENEVFNELESLAKKD